MDIIISVLVIFLPVPLSVAVGAALMHFLGR